LSLSHAVADYFLSLERTLSISAKMNPSEMEAPNSQNRFTTLLPKPASQSVSQSRKEGRERDRSLPVTGSSNHMLHLHRLQHNEVVSSLHGVAMRDRELDHLARHGRLHDRMVRGGGARGAMRDDGDGEVAVSQLISDLTVEPHCAQSQPIRAQRRRGRRGTHHRSQSSWSQRSRSGSKSLWQICVVH
jgi:hypothetical protein